MFTIPPGQRNTSQTFGQRWSASSATRRKELETSPPSLQGVSAVESISDKYICTTRRMNSISEQQSRSLTSLNSQRYLVYTQTDLKLFCIVQPPARHPCYAVRRARHNKCQSKCQQVEPDAKMNNRKQGQSQKSNAMNEKDRAPHKCRNLCIFAMGMSPYSNIMPSNRNSSSYIKSVDDPLGRELQPVI